MGKEVIANVRKITSTQIGVNIPSNNGYEIGDKVIIMPLKYSKDIEKVKELLEI